MADAHLDGSYCAACGRRIDEAEEAADAALEDREPCAGCGALERKRSISAADTLTFHESLGLIQRHAPGPGGGKGRRVLEVKSGEFPSADGTWSTVIQVVDRLHNRYRKFVRRSDGTLTRDEEVPLDEHQGYGSAKFAKGTPIEGPVRSPESDERRSEPGRRST